MSAKEIAAPFFLDTNIFVYSFGSRAPAKKRIALAPLCQVFPTFELYDRAITIRELYGLSFYDSLIVCGALQAGCKTLVTEDLQAGQRFESVTVLNPF
jgi:predicted nucleic acid-binding protein